MLRAVLARDRPPPWAALLSSPADRLPPPALMDMRSGAGDPERPPGMILRWVCVGEEEEWESHRRRHEEAHCFCKTEGSREEQLL